MKKITVWIIALSSMLSLNACFTTKYGPKRFTGGYQESKLEENPYQVTFAGNGTSSQERILQYALYRCAELAYEQERPYFRVLSHFNQTKHEQHYSWSSQGFTYCVRSYRISKPKHTIVIELLEQAHLFDQACYATHEVLSQLASEIQLSKKLIKTRDGEGLYVKQITQRE